jgi:polyhydroxyalkanoate synthase
VRFVLSSGGHIAGIVNPSNPKLRVLTSDTNPPSAQQWRDGAGQHDESWWED